MTRRLGHVLIAFVVAIAVGCDGGSEESATQTSPTTTTRESGQAALERAVGSTLTANRRLSVYVLWNNRIPSWAERSTRGPALAGLRTAAADRRKRGIRVRLLSDQFQVVSIRLDPSYTTATAIARGRQRVRPHRLNGTPAGRSVELNERARIELRRVGRTSRFVVWRVELLD
jgi:hypothetical protein